MMGLKIFFNTDEKIYCCSVRHGRLGGDWVSWVLQHDEPEDEPAGWCRDGKTKKHYGNVGDNGEECNDYDSDDCDDQKSAWYDNCQVRLAFRTLDKDGSGTIETSEFKHLMTHIGKHTTNTNTNTSINTNADKTNVTWEFCNETYFAKQLQFFSSQESDIHLSNDK